MGSVEQWSFLAIQAQCKEFTRLAVLCEMIWRWALEETRTYPRCDKPLSKVRWKYAREEFRLVPSGLYP